MSSPLQHKSDNDHRPKVQVLTAGGAASASNTTPSRGRRKRKNKSKKSTPKASETTVTKPPQPSQDLMQLEIEESTSHEDNLAALDPLQHQAPYRDDPQRQPHETTTTTSNQPMGSMEPTTSTTGAGGVPLAHTTASNNNVSNKKTSDLIWLFACFLGIMCSFVCYGLLLEYTTSGGRKLHELSFLFVTSGLYTLTAAAGRYVRDETPTTIPPARFAILGLTSMGSTFCSVRSLRYVIYPIQVLAKSCKPVPVMIMGAFMGKRYPLRKYLNVLMIVLGVALFMGGGDEKKKKATDETTDSASPSQMIGILLLFVSLCFDGGTGAYEDKLMSVHSVQPFDLMYNIQLGKTILAGIGLLVLNQLHIFIQMVQDMGFLLVALGLSGALGQVFIFVTIAKFGALTCSIIGLARKVTTLVASIYFYGHSLNSIQFTGLVISVGSMVMNFWGKKKPSSGGHGHHHAKESTVPEEMEKMLNDDEDDEGGNGDVELAKSKY